jgi:hypothetical protein
MERFARRVPGGGIAWENSVFTRPTSDRASRLVDAAVDIAWERLLDSDDGTRGGLSIGTQGRLLVFRSTALQHAQELPLAA